MNEPHAGQMRNVIALMHISLDGFCAGPNGELEWARVDEELYEYVADLVRTVDTALYGRITYGMMEGYWPTVPANPESTEHDLRHAEWVENVQKIVFSRTLDNVTWNNTRLVKDDIAEEVARLKRQPGGDMMIFGSPSIVHTLTRHGLIDDWRITVNPIVLGRGIPLFKDVRDTMNFKLLGTRTFRAEVVGLHYRTVPAGGAQ